MCAHAHVATHTRDFTCISVSLVFPRDRAAGQADAVCGVTTRGQSTASGTLVESSGQEQGFGVENPVLQEGLWGDLCFLAMRPVHVSLRAPYPHARCGRGAEAGVAGVTVKVRGALACTRRLDVGESDPQSCTQRGRGDPTARGEAPPSQAPPPPPRF